MTTSRFRSDRVTRLSLFVAATVAAAACDKSAAEEGGWTGSTEGLPGGAVLIKNPEQGVWKAGEEWRLEEELRIGSADAVGPEMFGSVAALEVDPLGRIWVLDRQTKDIRVFDAQGRHVRTVGREGAGPGEFGDPVGLAWSPEGNLWVVDPKHARYSVFDTAGSYLTQHRRTLAGYSVPWAGGFDAAGRLYEVGSVPTEKGGARSAVLRFDPALAPVDTLLLPEYQEPQFEFHNQYGMTAASVPFAPFLSSRVDPRGFVWFGVTDRYRIHQQTFAGDTARIVELAYQPVPVTAQEREDAVRGLGWFTRQGGKVEVSRIPTRKPAFRAIYLDDAGRLWVRPSTTKQDGGKVLDVFDPQGRYLGRVRPPFPLRSSPAPTFRGDHVYAVTEDDLGVPAVVRARILRDPRTAGIESVFVPILPSRSGGLFGVRPLHAAVRDAAAEKRAVWGVMSVRSEAQLSKAAPELARVGGGRAEEIAERIRRLWNEPGAGLYVQITDHNGPVEVILSPSGGDMARLAVAGGALVWEQSPPWERSRMEGRGGSASAEEGAGIFWIEGGEQGEYRVEIPLYITRVTVVLNGRELAALHPISPAGGKTTLRSR